MSPLRRTAQIVGRAVCSVRALWVVMLLVHVPALWGTWHTVLRDGFETVRPFSLAGLTLATLFFALKACGWRVLRFETDSRSLFVVLVAVVLLHANAVGAWLHTDGVPQELPLAATVLMAAGLSRVQVLLRLLLSERPGSRRTAPPGALRLRSPRRHRPRPRPMAVCCTPRAPPLLPA